MVNSVYYQPQLVESKFLTNDSIYNSSLLSDKNSLTTSQLLYTSDAKDPLKMGQILHQPVETPICKKVPFQFNAEKDAFFHDQLQQQKKDELASNQTHLHKIQEFLQQVDEENDSEDEGIEDYNIGGYHPVHVGEVLLNRYVTIQKLGWGHFSTVWLSKDFKYDTYVAIKIQKSAEHYIEAAYDEVEILQKVAEKANDPDWLENVKKYKKQENVCQDDCHVLQLLNCFVHRGPYGNHFCMVFEILGVNLLEIIKRYEFKGIPLNYCKRIAKQVLIGLDYLHTKCGVIHTDLKPENVLLQLTQEEIKDIIENGQLSKHQIYTERLNYYHELFGIRKLTKNQKRNKKRKLQKKRKQQQKEEEESENNQPTFNLNSDKISFSNKNQKLDKDFNLKVADLGNGCWTHYHFSTLIQTRQYRAPEVLLGINYNTSTDLWSFACMIFELLTGDFLFEPRKGHHFSKNEDHLAQIQELTGKFPLDFSLRGLKSKRYFDNKGNLLRIPSLNQWPLNNLLIQKFQFKPEEAKQFASFLEPMLIPYPEKRISARDALKHEWLNIGEDQECRMTQEQLYEYNLSQLEDKIRQPKNVEDDDADNSDQDLSIEPIKEWKKERFGKNYNREIKNFCKARLIENIKLVDQSFTNLGYIGFGEGIDINKLDSTGNWQFKN